MKVVVTGATGFIGNHVLERLKQEPVSITAVGRNRSRWNGIGNFVEMDLGCPPPVAYAKLGYPDVLLHLAWEGLPNYNSLHHYETELPKQYTFLKLMIEAGLPRLVVVGTCFEYGIQNGLLSETSLMHPNCPYGFAKYTLYQQLEYINALNSTEMTWARLFYLWGNGQPESSLFPQLVASVTRGEPVFNMSGGEQLRDFLPVSHVADYLVRMALDPRAIGVINVCSGKPVSVRSLVERWISENHWNIDLNLGFYPYLDHEPMAFWGDNSKLNKLLGTDIHA